MSETLRRLKEILEGLPPIRMTFDSARNFTLPCFCCGEEEKPRTLERVGTWSRRVGGRGESGDPIERPMCAACVGRCPEGATVAPPK